MRPAATSLVQCANSTILVKTNPAPIAHSVLRCREGSALAADASAPICTAWPDGKASSRFPESGTPRQCPRTVSRSGLSWSNIFFRMWGTADETSVVIRTWLLAPRDAESPDLAYSHHPTARAQRTCSSAPHVMSSAARSVRGPVWSAMASAIAISTCVGRTVKVHYAAARSTHPDDVFQFAERHRVSLEWLICGKLAGLLETVRGLPGAAARIQSIR
jgi:hypothetical protein